MPKVAAVPRHYMLTMTHEETYSLIIHLRAMARNFDVEDAVDSILAELEDKFEGELGEFPGDPIEEAA